jgi:hypothetical protein
VHDFGYCPLRPSEGFSQTSRLAHSSLFRRPASQLPILQLARSNWRILQGMRLAESRMILPPRISPGPRNQDEYDMCYGNGETH